MPHRRGTLVCIEGVEAAYTKGKHLTKRLAGLPGDSIVCKKDILFVARDKVGPVHPKTSYF